MSNGWKLELSTWGDKTTRLVFWDSATGVGDVVYILNADGTSSRSEYASADGGDTFEVTLIPVNLVAELRDLLARLDVSR